MSKLPIVEPDLQQWQLAFSRLYKPGWPPTWQQARDDPRYSPLLRGLAVALARTALMALPTTRSARLPPAATPRPARVPALLQRPPTFDARRAAANDRPDDD